MGEQTPDKFLVNIIYKCFKQECIIVTVFKFHPILFYRG